MVHHLLCCFLGIGAPRLGVLLVFLVSAPVMKIETALPNELHRRLYRHVGRLEEDVQT